MDSIIIIIIDTHDQLDHMINCGVLWRDAGGAFLEFGQVGHDLGGGREHDILYVFILIFLFAIIDAGLAHGLFEQIGIQLVPHALLFEIEDESDSFKWT